MDERKLWEADHPYYCNEGCFHAPGYHTRYACWADFMEGLGTSDVDMNLVFRWDWRRDDDDRAQGAPPEPVLYVFFVAQRKGFTFSAEVAVTPKDEPAVRAWLAGRKEHLLKLWEPL